MHASIIKIFFSTLLIFVPVRVLAESETQTVRSFVRKFSAHFTIEPEQHYSSHVASDDFTIASVAFQAGKAS